jgi:D-amino-acid dehydrogenase
VDTQFDIAVIGAGMVGTSSALWLQRSGHNVALIDRTGPGTGMFSRESPLRIDWAHMPRMAPWLVRFLRNCTQARVDAISQALASLLQHAEDGAFPLFKASGADALIRSRGCLYLYDTQESFAKAEHEIALRRRHGIQVDVLAPEEIGQLEPALAKVYAKGTFFPQAHQYVSPSGVIETMAAHFTANGGVLVQAEVAGITRLSDGTLELATAGKPLRCKQLVLAAGAFSKRLFGGVVEPLPLETERGFHVLFPGYQDALNRPVGWSPGGFYLTPMSHGLRAAGTVELGGLSDARRQGNLDHITRHARRLLPDLPERAESDWVGHRPTMPDSLPVIGRSARTPQIILAFGHQHVGMTLGGITGKLVAQIAGGETPQVDLAPFAPERF